MTRRRDGSSVVLHLPLVEINRRGDEQWSSTGSEALSARAILQPDGSGAHSKIVGHVAERRFKVLLDPEIGGHDFSDEHELSRLRFGWVVHEGRRLDVLSAQFVGHGSPRGMRHVELVVQDKGGEGVQR